MKIDDQFEEWFSLNYPRVNTQFHQGQQIREAAKKAFIDSRLMCDVQMPPRAEGQYKSYMNRMRQLCYLAIRECGLSVNMDTGNSVRK